MNNHKKPAEVLKKVVDELCTPSSYDKVYFRDRHHVSMPSVKSLLKLLDDLQSVLFPGYFEEADLTPETMPYYIGATMDRITRTLEEQFHSGFCVSCFRDDEEEFCPTCTNRSREAVLEFISTLPRIRELLASDVQAAYDGDPASKNINEVIYCYPSIKALTSYRIAHELYRMEVPMLPRIITEIAHSETGIDIHPGAQIGPRFFIDHGTGTVIGETCVIGKNVRVYQGVTLGAKSFPMDENGNPIKGIPRHPIVEDDVIIYSGATILGRVTLGKGSIIGGNVWLTTDVPPESNVVQRQPKKIVVQKEDIPTP